VQFPRQRGIEINFFVAAGLHIFTGLLRMVFHTPSSNIPEFHNHNL
jgi:hypothetical protein